MAGEKANRFDGAAEGELKLCPLTNENAQILMELFPYTRPGSHRGHRFTMGFGDRLGIASPGHIRALGDHDIYPILAQQSIRELNLTHRTFRDVIRAAAFNVFQEGYKKGYGADGDHLKTRAEIQYALSAGCTMVTLDCSEHIDQKAAALPQQEIDGLYAALPEDVRAHYEGVYLHKDLPVIGGLSSEELRRIVVVFHRAIRHAVDCFRCIDEIRTVPVDFELSIDETLTITTPAEHFVVGNELHSEGVTPISCAPHFSGAFEKGVE